MSIFGIGKKGSKKSTQEGSSSRSSRQSEQTSSPSRPKSPIRSTPKNKSKEIEKDFGGMLDNINKNITERINFLKESNGSNNRPYHKANFEQNMRDTYQDAVKNLVELFENLSKENLGGSNYQNLHKLLDVTRLAGYNTDTQVIQLKRRILGLFLGERLGNPEGHLETPPAQIYLLDNNQQKALIKKDDIIKLSNLFNQLPSDAVKTFQKESGITPEQFNSLKNTLKDITKDIILFLSEGEKLNSLKTSLSEMQDFHNLNNPKERREFVRGENLYHRQNNIQDIYDTGMTEHIGNIFSHFTKINSPNEIEKKLLNFLTTGNSSTGEYTVRAKPMDYFVDKMDEGKTILDKFDIQRMQDFFADPQFQNSFQTKLGINSTQFNKIKNTLDKILNTKQHKDEESEKQEHLVQTSEAAKSIETSYINEYRGEFQGNDSHLRQELQNKLTIINQDRQRIGKDPIRQYNTAPKHEDFVNHLMNEILEKRDSQFLSHYNKIFHTASHLNPLHTETQIVSLLLGKDIPEDKNPIQYFLEHHRDSKVFNVNGIRHLAMILGHERIKDKFQIEHRTTDKNKFITKTLDTIVKNYKKSIQHIKPFGDFINTSIKQITKESRFSHYDTDYIFKDEGQIERRLLGVIHSAGIMDYGYQLMLDENPYDNIQAIYQKTKEFSPEKQRNIKQIHNILQNLQGTNLKIFKDTYHCDGEKFDEIKRIFSKVVAGLDDAGSSRANLRSSSASSSESTVTHPRRPENLSSYSVSSSLLQNNIDSLEINTSVASSLATRTNPQHSTIASSSGSTTNDTRVPESFDLLGLGVPASLQKDNVDVDLYPHQGDDLYSPPTSSLAISPPKDMISFDDLGELYTLMNPINVEKGESSSKTNLQQSNTIFSPADIKAPTSKSINPFAEEEMPQSINPFLPEVEAISPPKNPFLSDDIGDLLTGSTNLSPLNETPYHPDYDLAILDIPKDDVDLDMIKDTYRMFRTELTAVAVQLLNNKVVKTRAEALRHPEYIEAKKNFKPKEDAYKRLKKYFKES